jgi:nitric oxide reductase subunit B
MQTIVWLRMPGDVIFAAGALMLALFIFRLFVGKAKEPAANAVPAEQPVRLQG